MFFDEAILGSLKWREREREREREEREREGGGRERKVIDGASSRSFIWKTIATVMQFIYNSI